MQSFKNSLTLKLFFCCVLLGVLGSFKIKTAEASMNEDTAKLFFNIHDFALQDTDGKLHQFSRKINSRFVVLYSYCIGCPIARKNLPELRALKTQFKKKDVDFYFIDSAAQDTREALKEEIEKYKLPFPVLIDETQEITRQLKINRTAEVLVVDMKNFKIMYRGPVDDKQGYSTEKASASKEYLKNALQALLKNKKVKNPYVKSLGCALSIRVRHDVTYYKNIAPILEMKCATCHVARATPPSNFFTYGGAKNWSTMIKEVIQTEQMPPWEADPELHQVSNQISLTKQEKEEIYSWIDSGMPEGKKEDYKKVEIVEGIENVVKNKSDYNGSYQMKSAVSVKADAKINWHYELVDVNNGEDYWINSVNIDAELSNDNLIQHIQLIVAKEEIPEIGLGKNEFLPVEALKKIHSLVNVPNQNSIISSNYTDKAHRIPKGAKIYLQVHFAKTGRDETANIKVLFNKFLKKGNLKEIFYDPRSAIEDFKIPANNESFVLKKDIRYERDVILFRLGPHMHVRGAHAKAYLKGPDDLHPKLIYSARYIFKNRRTYELSEPIRIKAGSVLTTEFEYDNSAANPARIDHNKVVGWGEDAYTGEMMLMHLFYLKEI